MEHVTPESESTAPSQAEVVPPLPVRRRRPGSYTAMLIAGVAALSYYPTGGGPTMCGGGFGEVPRRFRRGPCRVCGKPDVAAGRQRGVYLCGEHLHLEHERT